MPGCLVRLARLITSKSCQPMWDPGPGRGARGGGSDMCLSSLLETTRYRSREPADEGDPVPEPAQKGVTQYPPAQPSTHKEAIRCPDPLWKWLALPLPREPVTGVRALPVRVPPEEATPHRPHRPRPRTRRAGRAEGRVI